MECLSLNRSACQEPPANVFQPSTHHMLPPQQPQHTAGNMFAPMPQSPMPTGPPQCRSAPAPGPPPPGAPPLTPFQQELNDTRSFLHRQNSLSNNIFSQHQAFNPQQGGWGNQHACGQADGQGSWDPWASWTRPSEQGRPQWKINRKNTEGLVTFDGNLSHFRNWCSRIRDHAAEDWPEWRQVLDHASKLQFELTPDYLHKLPLFGVNAWQLSSDLWSFLLKWLGPTLYHRRMKMGHNIEGNGLELWRKLHSEFAGSDKLMQVAGRTRLQDFPQCRDVRSYLSTWNLGCIYSMNLAMVSGLTTPKLCSSEQCQTPFVLRSTGVPRWNA